MKKALAERALNAKLDQHLEQGESGNSRNGYGKKTVPIGGGKLDLDIPRDRQGTFDPQLIAKYQRRFPGLDDKIVSLYARGMSTREIAGHIRDEDLIRYKAVHIALGVRGDGTKDILGLWLEQNEGAKFWLRVMNELKSRGTDDILPAVVDGLRGFPDAIQAVFPQAMVQTCIIHLLRHSLEFVSWKDRREVAAALKDIYRALDTEAGEQALSGFETGTWGAKYPAVGQSWRRIWNEVVPFFVFPTQVRRILYTTNAIGRLNANSRGRCAPGATSPPTRPP